MKYKNKWLCAIMSLLMLLTAAPATAAGDLLLHDAPQPRAEALGEAAIPSVPEPTAVSEPTAAAEAAAEAQSAEILPDLTIAPPEPSPAATPETTGEVQPTSAADLESTVDMAAYTVRHCWLGDPETAICADVTGTAPVGEVFTYDARDEIPGYVYARSENSALTIDADETQNRIVLYYSRLLTLTSLSAEKVYDGAPLARSEVRLTGKLAAGDALSVLLDGRVTDVGSAVNSFREITIRRDGRDITRSGDYAITTREGTLTVLPAPIEITAGSAYKRVDGVPLTCNQWALSGGALAGGHDIASVRISGSQTELGESENLPSDAVILDESGADVTHNYLIAYCSGTLGVTERLPLLVIADSASKTYDGKPLADDGYSCHGLVRGDAIEAHVRGSITGAGTAENTVEGVMIIRNGREVTGEYEIAIRGGSLTVHPAGIEITAESATKEFDGAPLVCNGWALTRGALAQGDVIQAVTVSGSQTEAGESENLPSDAVILNARGADVTPNYEITYIGGTLRVIE